MRIAEQIETLLNDSSRFASARETGGRLWICEHPARRVRPAWRVAHDLQRQLESDGLQVRVAQQKVDGRSVPCIEVSQTLDRGPADEIQQLLIVSPAMLAKFKSVNEQLQGLNRRDPSYDNVRAFAALIEQGLFLSRRKVKENRRRVARVQSKVLKSTVPQAGTSSPVEPERSPQAVAPGIRSLSAPGAPPSPAASPAIVLERNGFHFGSFVAFSCAWEIHLEGAPDSTLRRLTEAAVCEVRRIEALVSAKQPGGLAYRIQQAGGESLELDRESELLIGAATRFWELSVGRFDLTTEALGRHWANQARLATLALPGIAPTPPEHGWSRITFASGRLRVPQPLSISLDALSRSYALDRVRHIVGAEWDGPAQISAATDLAVDRMAGSRSTSGRRGWVSMPPEMADRMISDGALSTCRRRRLGPAGDRLDVSPIVDGLSGLPVERAALAVTVVCGSSLDAYGLASAALAQGTNAEALLSSLPVRQYWVVR